MLDGLFFIIIGRWWIHPLPTQRVRVWVHACVIRWRGIWGPRRWGSGARGEEEILSCGGHPMDVVQLGSGECGRSVAGWKADCVLGVHLSTGSRANWLPEGDHLGCHLLGWWSPFGRFDHCCLRLQWWKCPQGCRHRQVTCCQILCQIPSWSQGYQEHARFAPQELGLCKLGWFQSLRGCPSGDSVASSLWGGNCLWFFVMLNSDWCTCRNCSRCMVDLYDSMDSLEAQLCHPCSML